MFCYKVRTYDSGSVPFHFLLAAGVSLVRLYRFFHQRVSPHAVLLALKSLVVFLGFNFFLFHDQARLYPV